MKRFFSAAAAIAMLATASAALAQAPAALPRLDINRAPAVALRTLPGIDDKRADAIAKGRPYRQPEDLVTRKIIPADVFEGLKARIFAGAE